MSGRKLEFEGVWFDGLSARKHSVRVQITPHELILLDSKGAALQRLPCNALRIPPGPGGSSPVNVEHPVDDPQNPRIETLVVEDPLFLRNLQRTAPSLPGIHWETDSWGWKAIFLGLALGLLFIYSLWKIAVPRLVDQVADRVPVEWEAELGRVVLPADWLSSQVPSTPEMEQAFTAIRDRLLSTVPDQPYQFRIYVVAYPQVNALALPGGTIVVFQGLLELTETPEELAGVLAHEFQHVLQRHSTRGILRALATGMIAALVVGDMNAVMGTALDLAGQLDSLSFNREMEREADREGMNMMLAAGIDPAGMLGIFEKFRQLDRPEHPADTESVPLERTPGLLDYLSTHPSGSDRLEDLKRIVRDHPGYQTEPLLADVDWKGVRGATD